MINQAIFLLVPMYIIIIIIIIIYIYNGYTTYIIYAYILHALFFFKNDGTLLQIRLIYKAKRPVPSAF